MKRGSISDDFVRAMECRHIVCRTEYRFSLWDVSLDCESQWASVFSKQCTKSGIFFRTHWCRDGPAWQFKRSYRFFVKQIHMSTRAATTLPYWSIVLCLSTGVQSWGKLESAAFIYLPAYFLYSSTELWYLPFSVLHITCAMHCFP